MRAQASRLVGLITASAPQLIDHACRLRIDDVVASMTGLPITDVVGDTVELPITIPPLDSYLPDHVGGLPYAAEFDALEDGAKQDYYERVADDLAEYRSSKGTLSVPFALHFVSATKATRVQHV